MTKQCTFDGLKDIIMTTKNKRYVLTSESNIWIMWAQDNEGHYTVKELFLKAEGPSRYDNKNAAISRMVMLDVAETPMKDVVATAVDAQLKFNFMG